MTNENYYKARRYLYRLDPILYRDVLHDAFVNYYTKTGLNLFDQNNHYIMVVIKNELLMQYRRSNFEVNGNKFRFEFVEFEDHRCTRHTPLDHLIRKDTYEHLVTRLQNFNKNKKVATKIFNLRIDGFTIEQIAGKIKLSKPTVQRYINNFGKAKPRIS